jgi:3-deoxy-manno-octulosonate cytidylyltransferase (CMP-KDO synthetase)
MPLFHVVIPARYASVRLPGKPLLLLAGKPMVEHVWNAARASGASSVVVATDDERIRTVCAAMGAECELTSAECASGTDRVAEVAARRKWRRDEIVVNLQADEPMMAPKLLRDLAETLAGHRGAQIATLATPIASLEEFRDPNCVKVVAGLDGTALYFSRACIPWPRDQAAGGVPAGFFGALRHIGVYAYRAGALAKLAAWPPTPHEAAEKLEQLRALEHGLGIVLHVTQQAPAAGVDTPEDLQRITQLLRGGQSRRKAC